MEKILPLITPIINWFKTSDMFEAFLYPFLISLGVFSAREVVKEGVKYLPRKWFSSYERNAEDIRELHTKVHDRLCDLCVSIGLNKQQSNFGKVKIRLIYSAARLRKHGEKGKLVADDIEELIFSLPNYVKDNLVADQETKIEKFSNLVEKIRGNLDKLWLEKC